MLSTDELSPLYHLVLIDHHPPQSEDGYTCVMISTNVIGFKWWTMDVVQACMHVCMYVCMYVIEISCIAVNWTACSYNYLHRLSRFGLHVLIRVHSPYLWSHAMIQLTAEVRALFNRSCSSNTFKHRLLTQLINWHLRTKCFLQTNWVH
jgi:hypothetical protein